MTPMPAPVKRRYDATRRRQAAARTRMAILDAARVLFTERGYTPTPMTAIAERAGVALDTVYASAGRKPHLALVHSIIAQAAPAEPELAALWAEIAERRAANMRRFVADLATVTPLRLHPGDAADIVWATNAAETYQLLVGQRGWTPQRYERFLADAWRRLLLPG